VGAGWEARPCLETPIELWYGPDDDSRRETNTEFLTSP
jgi:hypothetical protein